jgi:DNA mismatch repair protein MutS
MVLDYARHNGLRLDHIEGLAAYSVENFMSLDRSTRRSLELTQNLSDGSRAFTLVATLDETVTPMGARLLRRWIDQPLLERTEIEARHEAVGRIIEHSMTRGDLRDALKEVSDIERLVARCSTGHANPRDLAALRRSLGRLPEVEEAVRKVAIGKWRDLKKQLGDHRKLALTLEKALVEDPPPHLREGGLVKDGFDPELDKLRELSRNGKKYIAELESTEKEKLGVPLKVGYNSVFGYYLEISKAHSPQVPDHYVRKQTTAGAERYITAELKDHESAVLGAQEKAVSVEYDVFQRLRSQISAQAGDLLRTAKAIAEADVITALAESAVRNRYVRPEITDEDVLEIQAGRHPVVEREEANFVPNDSTLGVHDGEHARTMILTGPNMSGKSTYLRQNALIALMSQMGSFVPAESCRMGLCDRIFTRIGAKDELALGQSTFMVEMIESANILNNATDRSLVILDEVGRGTSTYDGLAIAWAMVEYLAEKGSKTFFATHYHQLNALADQLRSVRNYRINVEEIGEKVVWTHKVLPGGTDRSYGIHVARMAGVPSRVVDRAHEVLADLESTQDAPTAVGPSLQNVQLQLFEVEDPAVLRHLRSLDPNQLTPMQALAELERMKKEFSNER